MGGQQTQKPFDNRPTIYQQIETLKGKVSDLERCLKASNTEIDALRAEIKAQDKAFVNLLGILKTASVPATPTPQPEAVKETPKTVASYTPKQAREELARTSNIIVYPGEVQAVFIRNNWATLCGTNIRCTAKGLKDGMVTQREDTKWANITEKGLEELRKHFREVNR